MVFVWNQKHGSIETYDVPLVSSAYSASDDSNCFVVKLSKYKNGHKGGILMIYVMGCDANASVFIFTS